jgi:hypothetical protein
MANVLTLEEFRASRQDVPDVRMIYGDDDAEEPMPGYEYAGPCCILAGKDGADPLLVIYNQQWTGDLGYLERILYYEFYLPEICGQNG